MPPDTFDEQCRKMAEQFAMASAQELSTDEEFAFLAVNFIPAALKKLEEQRAGIERLKSQLDARLPI